MNVFLTAVRDTNTMNLKSSQSLFGVMLSVQEAF